MEQKHVRLLGNMEGNGTQGKTLWQGTWTGELNQEGNASSHRTYDGCQGGTASMVANNTLNWDISAGTFAGRQHESTTVTSHFGQELQAACIYMLGTAIKVDVWG